MIENERLIGFGQQSIGDSARTGRKVNDARQRETNAVFETSPSPTEFRIRPVYDLLNLLPH